MRWLMFSDFYENEGFLEYISHSPIHHRPRLGLSLPPAEVTSTISILWKNEDAEEKSFKFYLTSRLISSGVNMNIKVEQYFLH